MMHSLFAMLKVKSLEALQRYHDWKSEPQHLGRYSIKKLVTFHTYQQTASRTRVALVILLAPLPTLTVLCALDTIPLQDPRKSVVHHGFTFARSALSHSMLTYAMLAAVKQALVLTDNVYSHKTMTIVSVLTGMLAEALWTTVAFTWRFPVPFREFIGVAPWSALIVVLNYGIAYSAFARVMPKLRKYAPVVGTQLVLFYAFLGLSFEFANVSTEVQVAMILLFPVSKVLIKRFLWQYACKLDDVSTDVTVCMVEISGSLYQTVCMQFVKSKLLGSLVMILDFVQAAVEVQAYIKHDYMSDGRSSLRTAIAIIKDATSSMTGRDAESSGRRLTSRKSGYIDERLAAAARGSMVVNVKRPVKHSPPTSRKNVKVLSDDLTTISSSRRSSRDAIATTLTHSIVLERTMIQRSKSHRLLDLRRITVGQDEERSGRDNTESSDGNSVAKNANVRGLTRVQSAKVVPTHASARYQVRFGVEQLRDAIDSNEMPASANTPLDSHPSEASGDTPPQTLQRRHYIGKRRSSASHVFIDGVLIPRKDQARILEQTLQLFFACEVLIFVEYMEVFMPCLYGASVGALWHLPNAKYNLILMDMTQSDMASNVVTLFAYAAAEVLSFVSMAYVIRNKYGVSALYLLAFVLETYWLTLQGKLIGCFITIMNSATLHQGIDFSFQFDYHALLDKAAQSSSSSGTGSSARG